MQIQLPILFTYPFPPYNEQQQQPSHYEQGLLCYIPMNGERTGEDIYLQAGEQGLVGTFVEKLEELGSS